MIEVNNVAFTYPHTKKQIFSNYSIVFERNEITAVTGNNGSGKTTLSKLLVGMLRPDAGNIVIDGADIADMDLCAIGKKVGYVFQNPDRQLFNDTVYNEVAFGLQNMNLPNDEIEQISSHYLSLFGLTQYREIFPGKLSHGEKQRLALAAVLALGADYLVLDEPTTGLDVRRQRELGDLLENLRSDRGCGIILISHSNEFLSRHARKRVVIAQ